MVDGVSVKALRQILDERGKVMHRFAGTLTTSACLPFEATRSPTEKPVQPSPTSIARPTLQ